MSDEPDMTRRRALRSLTLPSLLLPVLGAGTAATSATAQEGGDGSTLVAFLSRSGNTRVVAGQLQRRFGADLFEIRTAEPYPADYEETVARAQRERDAEATPPLAERLADVGGYETVFLGFPVWGMALPAPVRTFLATHDLSGKTLVPFITHGGYGTGSAPETLAALAPRARIVTPFVREMDQERATMTAVADWLAAVGPEL
jgi:flavodoxin